MMSTKKIDSVRRDLAGLFSKDFRFRLVVACLALAATTLSAVGQGVHLQWDANAEPDLAGYRVYRSLTSGSAYSPLNLSLISTPDYTDPEAAAGATNYYVVTAVNNSGLESGYSNQVAVYVEPVPAPNQNPTADAGPDQQQREGRQVTLHGSGGDPDGDSLNYHWTQVSGPTATLGNPNQASTSFVAPAVTANTSLVFQLLVDDGRGGQASDSTVVTVLDNRAPLVEAGSSQTVDFGQTVQLTGSASDPDNDPITYSWLQTAGAPVSLSGANSATATFTAPSSEDTLVFQLVASDDQLSGSDTVQVTVANLNEPPTANAGPDLQVRERRHGNLAGAGTDLNGDSLTYHWTQTSGPTASLITPNQSQTEFVAPSVDADTPIVFQLMVEDPRGSQGTDEVNVLITANRPPVVGGGGDRTADFSEVMQLTGTASDPDEDPLTYRWVQTSGTPVSLTGSDSLSLSFTAPASEGSLVFQLTASDDEFSATDSVAVAVADTNRLPVVNAGPDQSAKENRSVSLLGSGSDPDGDPITFQWTQISGPEVTLDSTNTAETRFKAPKVDQDTVLVFRLVVRDDHGGEASDETLVSLMDNRPPGVSAAIVSSDVGFDETVVLEGEASDPDGDPLQYSWVQTGGTPVQLNGANSLNATFVAPTEEGMLTFEFTATDEEFTANVSLPIQVLPNRDPRVQAGPDLVVRERLVGRLSASGSDPDGDPVTYSWRQTAGPSLNISGANKASATFTAPETDADLYVVFEVTASDGQGGTATASQLVTITNNLPPKADAGPDGTVVVGQNVRLVGGAEDPNGDDLQYGWVQISGPHVALDRPYRDVTSFTAPDTESVLVFRLTANDDEFRSEDTVRLKVVSIRPLAFPAKVSGPEFEDMFVGLALANLRDRLTGVTLSGLDETGLEMGRAELNGLAPLGQNAFLAGDFPDLAERSTSILATGSEAQLRGFFMVGDWGGRSLDGVGGELIQSPQLTFPIAKRAAAENTLLYLFNPNTASNDLSVRLFSPEGLSLGETELTLAPNGSISATMDDFFGLGVETDDGYLEVVGDLPVRGFELFRRPGGLLSAAGTSFTPVTKLSAPHFFIDGEGSGSELRLLSGSTRPALVTITAFDDDGQPIGDYQEELAPREMFVRDVGDMLQLDAGAGVRTGYLEIDVRSQPFGDPVRVSGLITFQANRGEAMASLPLVTEGRTETQFLQVAQSSEVGVFTGLTVLNPGDTAVDVTLEAFDENGINTGRVEFTLEPGHRLAGLLGDEAYFGPNFEQVKGHLRLTSSAPVNAFALFGDYNLNYFAALEGQ